MPFLIPPPDGLSPAQIALWNGLTTSPQLALLAWPNRKGNCWMDIVSAATWLSESMGMTARSRTYNWTIKPLLAAGLLFDRVTPWPNYSRTFHPTKAGREMLRAIHGEAK